MSSFTKSANQVECRHEYEKENYQARTSALQNPQIK